MWHWFSLVWLAWMIIPVVAVFDAPRSLLEYLYMLMLVGTFVGVFVWAFYEQRWADSEARAYRIPSLVGMATSYALLGLMFPVIGWNGIGVLIYAGSFAGTQRSFWPSWGTIFISGAAKLTLTLTGELTWLTGGYLFFFTAVAALVGHLSRYSALSRLGGGGPHEPPSQGSPTRVD